MNLGKNISKICKERGITLSQLAKKSDVSQSTLFGWQNGRTVRNMDDLKKICDILEISLYRLLYGEPDPHELGHEEILKELFTGDIRVSIHRIDKGKSKK